MKCHVHDVWNNEVKEVKNLRWLLENCCKIENFSVTEYWKPEKAEAFLVARLNGGKGFFTTAFANKNLLWQWLMRKKFTGIKVDWFGTIYECKPEFAIPEVSK